MVWIKNLKNPKQSHPYKVYASNDIVKILLNSFNHELQLKDTEYIMQLQIN